MKEFSNLHKNHLAAMDLFRDLEITNDKGAKFIVPLMYANEDKIKTLLKVEKKIKPPLLFMYNSGITPALDMTSYISTSGVDLSKGNVVPSTSKYNVNYHLHVLTLYEEDMNNIIEKVLTVFKTKEKEGFRLTNIANNYTPGDNIGELTCIKWLFSFSNVFEVK